MARVLNANRNVSAKGMNASVDYKPGVEQNTKFAWIALSSSFLFPFQFTFGVCILELRQRIRANWLPPRTRLAPLILQVKSSSEPLHDQTSQNR